MGILIVLVFLIITFVVIVISKKERTKKIKQLKIALNEKRMIKIEAIVSRVNVINKAKNSFDDIYEGLTKIHAEMYSLVRKTSARIDSVVPIISKMKKRKFTEIIKIIEADIATIKSLEIKFILMSKKVTQKEEFLRDEISFYKKNLRVVIKVYREKRILLNRIAENIDALNNKIKNNSHEFEKALDAGNTVYASEILRSYSKNIIKFTEVINEGPSVQTYLYTIIPNLIKELVSEFQKKKNDNDSSFEHINFKTAIENIAIAFKKAKNDFLKLNVSEASKLVRQILKSIKIIEKNINYEISSRNFFVKNYSKAIKETGKVLNDYVSLRKNIRGLISKGFQVSNDLSELTYKIEDRQKTLDDFAVKFKKVIKNNDIPYSSKIARLKSLMQKVNELKQLINSAIEIVWTLNMRHLIVKNKFRKSESALNEIIANTKKYKITITPEEQGRFDDILKSISEIATDISKDNITNEVAKEVDDLSTKITSYYEAVGGKIEMVLMIKNLLNELSKERAIDDKLNYELIRTEKQFLDGQYTGALNTIVLFLETRRK